MKHNIHNTILLLIPFLLHYDLACTQLPLVIPIAMLLVNLAIVLITLYTQPVSAGLAVGLIALGIPFYVVGVLWQDKPKALLSLFGR